MKLPRRGEVAAYIAKQFDVPFGDEQKRIARLKEGAVAPETANEIAKLLVRRINRLFRPADESSPADEIERKIGKPSYRLFFDEAAKSLSLEFLWRDGAKFFHHHAVVSGQIKEMAAGLRSGPNLQLEIYLFFFVLPVVANNIAKYEVEGRTIALDCGWGSDNYWFLPSIKTGRGDSVTPMAKAIAWLRTVNSAVNWQEFLCPQVEPESALRGIERWRAGDTIPSSENIEAWASRFGGDRAKFRYVFHLCAATTRIWRHLLKEFGYSRAIQINAHLLDLIVALRVARERSQGPRPNFDNQPPRLKRCFGWLYSGPQAGPISLGPNYEALVIEMQTAFIAGKSPFE